MRSYPGWKLRNSKSMKARRERPLDNLEEVLREGVKKDQWKGQADGNPQRQGKAR